MKGPQRENWLEVASVCDRGLVRPENQDAVFSHAAAGLFLVADGMGGGQGGARASALVVENFRAIGPADDLATRLDAVCHAVETANAAIAAHAREAGFRQMGSTVAALLLGDAVPGPALAVWVGDSRIYRIRGRAITQLTNDHTVANELFGNGAAASGGYSRSLPYAHVLTRALGVEKTVKADARRFETRPGDRYLVCSDGVHDMLTDAHLAELIASVDSPEAAIPALSEAVRAAGAVDNFTATVVFLKECAK